MIDHARRIFLWKGGKGLSVAAGLVKWDEVCKAKCQGGGWGVLNLKNMNAGLLGKWLWKYTLQEGMLWRKLISFLLWT